MYYAEGKTKKFTLGVFPAMSLADAKAKAIEYADRDPVAKKLQAKLDDEAARLAAENQREADELEKMSLRTMTDLWNEYSSLPRYNQKAESSRKEERCKWGINIKPVLGNIPVKDIIPVIVNTLIKNLAKKSPVSGNRLFSFMQVLFKPALADGSITVHPMQALDKPANEKPRCSPWQ